MSAPTIPLFRIHSDMFSAFRHMFHPCDISLIFRRSMFPFRFILYLLFRHPDPFRCRSDFRTDLLILNSRPFTFPYDSLLLSRCLTT